MEFRDQDIARLVLGYLKNESHEKCQAAYDSYLEYCRSESSRYTFTSKKAFPTRVQGLTLYNYLHEYAEAYDIVQARLEETSFFVDNPSRSSLPQQIHYLLLYYDDLYAKNVGELDNTGIEKKCHKSTPNPDDKSNDMSQALDVEILTHTLENRTLHKKLAARINREVTLLSSSAEEQGAAIKTVVQKTEEDPIFDKLVADILDSIQENDSPENLLDPARNVITLHSSTPKKSCEPSDLKKRLRSSRKPTGEESVEGDADMHSLEAMQSIVSIAQSNQDSSEQTVVITEAIQPTYVALPVSSASQTSIANGIFVIQSAPTPSKCVQFSEQDVMSMPIVMCSGDQQTTFQSQPIILKNGGLYQSNMEPQRYLNIVPKPAEYNVQKAADFLSGFTPDMPLDSARKKSKAPARRRKSVKDPPQPIIVQVEFKQEVKEEAAAEVSEVVEKETEKEKMATPETAAVKRDGKAQTNRSGSKSGSHIRQLDFTTPEKLFASPKRTEAPEETKEITNTGGAKSVRVSLFGDSDKKPTIENADKLKQNKRTSSWDADLRASLSLARDNRPEPKSATKKKLAKRTTKEKEPNTNLALNQTEEDGKKIEMVLRGNEEVESEQPPVTDREGKENIDEEVGNGDSDKVDSSETEKKVEAQKDEVKDEEEPTEPPQFAVINRNDKPRIRKKCNQDSGTKRVHIIDDVVITNVPKIKSCEPLLEGNNTNSTLVLSPSKFNANKRSLVENPEGSDVGAKECIPKFNAMPTLETPVKFDPLSVPKTPDLTKSLGPAADTPFTKALLDQLQGVDLSSIPTPKFPITPNFANTPAAGSASSTYPNCPTDYSTSSSYYHPSDSEQNKSLEQIIEECNRLEKPPSSSDQSQASKKRSTGQKKRKSDEGDTSKGGVQDKLHLFNSQMVGRKNLDLVKCFVAGESDCCDSTSSSTCSSSCSGSQSDSSDDSSMDDIANETVIDKRQECYSLRPRRSARNIEANKKLDKKPDFSTTNTRPPPPPAKTPIKPNRSILEEMEAKRQRTIAKLDPPPQAKKTTPKSAKTTKPPKGGKVLKAAKNAQSQKAKAKTKAKRKSDSPKKLMLQTVATDEEDEVPILHLSSDGENHNLFKNLDVACSGGGLKVCNAKDEGVLNKVEPVDRALEAKKPPNKVLEKRKSTDKVLEKKEPDNKALDKNAKAGSTGTNRNGSKTGEMATKGKKSNNEPKSSKAVSLETKSNTKAVIEKSKRSEKEAESLVKGLKQWGFHLVPNKSKSNSSEEHIKPQNKTESSISSKSRNRRASIHHNPDRKKDINTAMRSRSLSESKRRDKHDDSIEEGEIVSEDEYVPKKRRRSPKRQPKKISHQEYKQRQQHRKASEMDKNTKSKEPKKETATSIPETQSTKDGNSPVFDTKADHQIFLAKHEESRIPDMTGYSSQILSKKITLTTYFEELGKDVDINITCTKFESLFDLPSNIQISPLENLYSNQSGPAYNSRPPERRRSRCERRESQHSKRDVQSESKGKETEPLSKATGKSCQNNDDLMNYAIIGSERVENINHVQHSDSKKRKAAEDVVAEKVDKKSKTDCDNTDLLKSLDVDIFLKKLHGE